MKIELTHIETNEVVEFFVVDDGIETPQQVLEYLDVESGETITYEIL